MHLYHFTSAAHLHAISQHGLTVGDVVTDLDSFKGKIGVWLTSSTTPEGHGLSGSTVDKTEFRLLVDVPENRMLWKWTDWAQENLSPEIRGLLDTPDAHRFEEFYVYFGWLPTERIIEVTSTITGELENDWGRHRPESDLALGVPFRKRYDWQKRTLRNVRNALTLITAERAGAMH